MHSGPPVFFEGWSMTTNEQDRPESESESESEELAAFEMSEAAGAHLARMLDNDTVGSAVRFVFGLAGLEQQPSAELPGDTVYRYQGRTVLLLDRTMTRMLAGKTLDVEITDDGPRLHLS